MHMRDVDEELWKRDETATGDRDGLCQTHTCSVCACSRSGSCQSHGQSPRESTGKPRTETTSLLSRHFLLRPLSSSSSSSSSIPYSFLLSPRVYDPTTPKDLPCALGLVKILPCSCLVQRLILRLVVANDLKRPTLPAAGAEAGVRCTISKPLVLSSMTKAQRTMRPEGPKRSWQIGLCS